MHDVTHEKREKRRKTPLSSGWNEKLSVPGWIEKVLQSSVSKGLQPFTPAGWSLSTKQAECCSVNTPRHKSTQRATAPTSCALDFTPLLSTSPVAQTGRLSSPSVCLPLTYLPTNPGAKRHKCDQQERREQRTREGSDASLEGNTDAWVDLKTGNTLQFTPRATSFHLDLSRKHS